MAKEYSYFKSQEPTSQEDYTETVTKGFDFVDEGTVVTKLSICAETNLSLIVTTGKRVMNLHFKQGATWNVENEDKYTFTSIKVANETAKVTYLLGCREQ